MSSSPYYDLYRCHSCRARNHTLAYLPSGWPCRFVLLCKICRTAINSAEACAYCFSDFTQPDDAVFFQCSQCRRCVHLGCVPIYHCCPTPSDPDKFLCIDCRIYLRCMIHKVVPTKRIRVLKRTPVADLEAKEMEVDEARNGSKLPSCSVRQKSECAFKKARNECRDSPAEWCAFVRARAGFTIKSGEYAEELKTLNEKISLIYARKSNQDAANMANM